METVLVLLLILVGPLGWGLIFIPMMRRIRETKRLRTDPTRRTETIDNKEYVVYTERRKGIRLITARRAARAEQKKYEQEDVN